MTISIFLADDHQLVRQGLRLLLESEPDFEVVGEAGDGIQTVKTVIHLQPNILIVDMVMPNLNGIEVTRTIKRHLTDIHIILLSMYDTESYVLQALEAGASAYVLKESTSRELTNAIHETLAGRIYLSLPLNQEALADYGRRVQETQDPYDSLTTREREILQMAADGLNNPQIAERLMLSVRTVETHRANMLKKLNLKNQTELVRYALQRGLVK